MVAASASVSQPEENIGFLSPHFWWSLANNSIKSISVYFPFM